MAWSLVVPYDLSACEAWAEWALHTLVLTGPTIRMGNNVVEQSFQLYYTKNILFFSSAKNGFFVKHIPKICCILGTHHFSKI